MSFFESPARASQDAGTSTGTLHEQVRQGFGTHTHPPLAWAHQPGSTTDARTCGPLVIRAALCGLVNELAAATRL